MKCLRCGWCCENMGLFGIPCSKLIHEDGIAVCTIYRNRPERCAKEDMGGAAICPVGMSTLKLSPQEAIERWQEIERNEDIRECMKL